MLFKALVWVTLVLDGVAGPQVQLACGLALYVVQLAVHARFEPYNDSQKNGVQYLALVLAVLICFFGLLINHFDLSIQAAQLRRDHVLVENLENDLATVNQCVDVVAVGTTVLAGIYILRKLAKFARLLRQSKNRGCKGFLLYICCCRSGGGQALETSTTHPDKDMHGGAGHAQFPAVELPELPGLPADSPGGRLWSGVVLMPNPMFKPRRSADAATAASVATAAEPVPFTSAPAAARENGVKIEVEETS